MEEYIKIPNIYVRDTGTKKLIEGTYSSDMIAYLAESQWDATEKIDGTNIRVIWDGYRVSLKGRTDKAEIPKPLMETLEKYFVGTSNEEIFEQLFGKKPAILYGEGAGGKIQGNNGYGETDFYMFDAKVNGWWLKRQDVVDIAKQFYCGVVPIVGHGTLPECVEYIKKHPQSKIRERELEGIVCRPAVPMFNQEGEPIMVKIKCRDF